MNYNQYHPHTLYRDKVAQNNVEIFENLNEKARKYLNENYQLISNMYIYIGSWSDNTDTNDNDKKNIISNDTFTKLLRQEENDLVDSDKKVFKLQTNIINSSLLSPPLSKVPPTTSICFVNCRFNEAAIANVNYNFKSLFFYKCIFEKRVSFDFIKSNREFSFVETEFKSDLSIDYCLFKNRLFFAGCIFNKKVALKNSIFKSLLVLKSCTFHTNLPDFRFTQFAIYPDTSTFEFKDSKIKNHLIQSISQIKKENTVDKEKKLRKAEFIFRRLKQIASHNQNHQRQQRFFSLEMYASSKTGNRKAFPIIANTYEIVSEYGRSIRKPLFFLGILFITFLLINSALFFSIFDYEWEVIAIDSLKATLKNSVPLGLGIPGENYEWLYEMFESKDTFINIIVFGLQWLHFVLSSILWFLFLLGVRNRFLIN